MTKIRVIELFGGIGACSKALERLGFEVEIVDYVEIDKFAVASFNALHGTDFRPQDITKWDKDIKCDLIMHGSPCQDFSVAGLGRGGDAGSGTRSSLMYETLRIVEKLKPKYVIWENVKNLLSKKHKHNFDAYQNAMEQLGYSNHYKILNAKYYGVPQNRERVFTVSIRKDLEDNFEFPDSQIVTKRLKDILETDVDEKFYLTDEQTSRLVNTMYNSGKLEIRLQDENSECRTLLARDFKDPKCVKAVNRIGGLYDSKRHKHQAGSVYDDNAQSPTLSTMGGGNLQPMIIDDSYASRDPRITKNSPTVRANRSRFKVAEPIIVASRGRNPSNPSDRTKRCQTEQRLEPNMEYVSNTLTSVQKDNYVKNNYRIRKLTPKECWRLMGFDDQDFGKAAAVNSNSQLYKQAGNSIVVNVLEAILNNLLDGGNDY